MALVSKVIASHCSSYRRSNWRLVLLAMEVCSNWMNVDVKVAVVALVVENASNFFSSLMMKRLLVAEVEEEEEVLESKLMI